MAEILVGLTNGKTSFWDPNTRAYITLSNKTKKITFDENHPDIGVHLERICHALFASNPSLKLYEGKIPEAAMEHWKAKFNLSGLNIAKNRADKLHAKSAVVTTQEDVVAQQSVKAAAAKVEEEAPAVEAQATEETEKKNTRSGRKTAK